MFKEVNLISAQKIIYFVLSTKSVYKFKIGLAGGGGGGGGGFNLSGQDFMPLSGHSSK